MLIYMFVYIYQTKFDRRSIALRIGRRRSSLEVGVSTGVLDTHGPHPRPLRTRGAWGVAPGPSHPPHRSRAGGPCRVPLLSLGPSFKGIDGWGGQQIRMTGIFHPILLWPHVLSCSLWYTITFPKMVSIRMERERICRNVYLSTAHEFRTLDRKTHSPKREQGRGDLVTLHHQVQGTWLPPHGHLT